jgi:hypothetical protein
MSSSAFGGRAVSHESVTTSGGSGERVRFEQSGALWPLTKLLFESCVLLAEDQRICVATGLCCLTHKGCCSAGQEGHRDRDVVHVGAAVGCGPLATGSLQDLACGLRRACAAAGQGQRMGKNRVIHRPNDS